jgi:O-acetylhomoserine (thiol)-lyase
VFIIADEASMTRPRYPGFDTLTLHAAHAASHLPDPAVAMLEARVAALEGGVAAIATASVQAALHLAVGARGAAGSHVVAADTLDAGPHGLLAHGLRRFGIDTTFVDARDPDAWRAAICPQTCLLVAPIIGGAGLNVLDLPRVGALAHEHGLPLLVDATLATPWLLQPLEHGADLVLHAAGNYLAGRGDGAGALLIDGGTFDWQHAFDTGGRFAGLCEPCPRFGGIVFSEESTVGAFALRARREGLEDFGAAMSPFEGAAILHGVETLGLRMGGHVANARKIAAFLAGHAALEAVAYPELDGHADRALAATLLPRGSGAVLTVRAYGGAAAGQRLVEALRLFAPSNAVGGVRSLAALLDGDGGAPGTVRLSVGLEDADDLIEDLERALKIVQKAVSTPARKGD